VPSTGKVHIVFLTDRQYEMIISFDGRLKETPPEKSDPIRTFLGDQRENIPRLDHKKTPCFRGVAETSSLADERTRSNRNVGAKCQR
jgi:hypothetical protein